MSQISKPDRKNVCPIIVTYHPDTDFPARLNKLSNQFDTVVIVDNNSDCNSKEMLQKLQCTDINLIFNKNNLGVATALNMGMDWANEHGFCWILTFDQDTIVEDGLVDTYADAYSSASNERNIAIIGANFKDKINGVSLIPQEGKDSWIDIPTVITSGSMISLKSAIEIGRFRDDFFIDYLDAEYCLRARRLHYDVIITRRVLMHHAIGSPRWHRFFGRRLITPHAPPERRYYMSRNHKALIREYYRIFPDWFKQLRITRTKEIILIILFEKNKLRKLGLTILGMFHGLIGRMGPLHKDK